MRMVKALDAGPIHPAGAHADPRRRDLRRAADCASPRSGAIGADRSAGAHRVRARRRETPQDDARRDATRRRSTARQTRVDWTAGRGDRRAHHSRVRPAPGAFTRRRAARSSCSARACVAHGRPTRQARCWRSTTTGHDGRLRRSGAVQRHPALHPAGKRRSPPQEWARGRGISVGERLS